MPRSPVRASLPPDSLTGCPVTDLSSRERRTQVDHRPRSQLFVAAQLRSCLARSTGAPLTGRPVGAAVQ